MSLAEFMENVICDPSGCWLWNGAGNRYGKFNGRPAHRVSWELHQGPIPDGLVILHGCDVKGCVNPAHLRPGTERENAHDRARAIARKGMRRQRIPREPTKQLHIRLTDGELAELRRLALAHDTSMVRMARRAMRIGLATLAEQPDAADRRAG